MYKIYYYSVILSSRLVFPANEHICVRFLERLQRPEKTGFNEKFFISHILIISILFWLSSDENVGAKKSFREMYVSDGKTNFSHSFN